MEQLSYETKISHRFQQSYQLSVSTKYDTQYFNISLKKKDS